MVPLQDRDVAGALGMVGAVRMPPALRSGPPALSALPPALPSALPPTLPSPTPALPM